MVATQSLVISQLTETENLAVQQYIHKLLNRFGNQIVVIYLFGSKSRGDSTPDSDIDILVLAQVENWDIRTEMSHISSDVDLEYDVLLNTTLISYERWQQMSRERFTLCRNVEREGIILFSR